MIRGEVRGLVPLPMGQSWGCYELIVPWFMNNNGLCCAADATLGLVSG